MGVSRTVTAFLALFGGMTGMSFGRFLGPGETLLAVLAGAALCALAGRVFADRIARVRSSISHAES